MDRAESSDDSSSASYQDDRSEMQPQQKNKQGGKRSFGCLEPSKNLTSFESPFLIEPIIKNSKDFIDTTWGSEYLSRKSRRETSLSVKRLLVSRRSQSVEISTTDFNP